MIPGGIHLEKESDKRTKSVASRDADYKDAEAVNKAARDFDLSSNQAGAQGREGRAGVQQSYTGETIGSTESRGIQTLTKERTTSRGRTIK